MSRKNIFTFLLVAFALLAFSVTDVGAQSTQGGKISLAIRAEDAPDSMVRAQDDSENKKGPTFFDRIKRSLQNLTKESDDPLPEKGPVSPQGRPKTTPSASVPTSPPKPVRAEEARESTDNKKTSEQNGRSETLERRMANVASPATPQATVSAPIVSEPQAKNTTSRDTRSEEPTVAQEDSIYDRMRNIRTQAFGDLPTEREPTYQVPLREPSRQTVPEVTVRQSVPAQRTAPPRETVVEPAPKVSVPARDETQLHAITEQRQSVDQIDTPPMLARQPMRTAPIRSNDRDSVSSWQGESHESIEPTPPSRTPAYQSGAERLDERKLPNLAGIAVPNESPSYRPRLDTDVANSRGNTPKPVTQNSVVQSNRPADSAMPNGTDRLTKPQTDSVTVLETTYDRTHSTAAKPVNRERASMVSPQLEVETEGSSRVIVGQESAYKIRVANRGGGPAEQVVLTVEVPNWIEILPPDVSTGTTSIVPKADNKDSREFLWKISRVGAMAEEQLVLHLVPQQRKTVDLRIRYDFYRPSIQTKIFVQEPVIEMDLQGPSEVLWGTKVGYKLSVRNTGNGDAEDVLLELLQTGSDMKTCPLPLLKAGEEQVIDVDVWTGKQEHIDINILATGAYDLSKQVSKRVIVLRPEITIGIESAEMQFVDSPATFALTVRNEGGAPATDLELIATVPLGARYISNTSGGQANPQNQVVWNIPSIPVGGSFNALIVCEPKREGICKLEASLNDRSGQVASCSGTINAEAIADLRIQVDNPQGPVEVGQDAVYAINVTNRGTKTAEDVDVIAAFVQGVEPFALEGSNGTMHDGQVVFDRIPAIIAGQTIALKVKAKADRPGNHKMRTEVVCTGVNTHLVFEQATYFYQKSGGKDSSVASGRTSDKKSEATESDRTPQPPTTLGTIRSGSEPLPLREATLNKVNDPFLR